MLKLTISGEELFDNKTQTFSSSFESFDLELEHSLLSLSKWESYFERPFLSANDKTDEEVMFYVKCMIITPDVEDNVVDKFSLQNIEDANTYINSNQSATTFGDLPERKGRGETITAELIYYWLVAFTIPFECENWHLNRLFSLIKICNIKNAKPDKKSKAEVAQRNRDLNEQRKAQLGTTG